MKRKLLKYELMATSRLYLPLYLVMVVFALLGRLSLWRLPWQLHTSKDALGLGSISFGLSVGEAGLKGQILGTVVTVIMTLYGLVVLGALVVHFIITLQRFWKNLMGDEGYLMFTLPVSTGDILWAKAICAFLWGIATTLMVAAAILLLIWHPLAIEAVREELAKVTPDTWTLIGQMARNILPPVLRVMLVAELLVNGFGDLFLLYASMAMGHTVKRYKVLASLGAYAAIVTVIGMAASLLMGAFLPAFAASVPDLELFSSTPELLLFSRHMGDFLTGTWAIVLVLDLATAAGCFFLARYLLRTQLNLE